MKLWLTLFFCLPFDKYIYFIEIPVELIEKEQTLLEDFIRTHLVVSFLGYYNGTVTPTQFFLLYEKINAALATYENLLLLKFSTIAVLSQFHEEYHQVVHVNKQQAAN